jgi:hypothetical protein
MRALGLPEVLAPEGGYLLALLEEDRTGANLGENPLGLDLGQVLEVGPEKFFQARTEFLGNVV